MHNEAARIRLYSTQPLFVFEHLLAQGTFHARPQLDEDWICAESRRAMLAYEWLIREMGAFGLPRPTPTAYPIWAWHQYFDGKGKPDLRDSAMKAEAVQGRQVLLTIELPASLVLLHDYELWHHPLNHYHLGTLRQTRAFDRRCEQKGLSPYTQHPLPDRNLRAELEASWRMIFNLKRCRQHTKTRADDQVVQATFWELRLDHIVEAVAFGGGRRKERIYKA